jgi:hypothetical protein
MIKPLLLIGISIAFLCWGLYGFAAYALPLLFDLSWQPIANPQLLVVHLLAWLGRDGFLWNMGSWLNC